MGATQAQEMANMGKDMGFPLETILGYHLQSNHFPAISTRWIGPAIEAINACNDWDPEHIVKLKEDYGFVAGNGQPTLTAATIVEGLHLEFWVNNEEEE